MKYVCDAWQADRYTLISSFEQLDEFRRVTRYERIQKYLRPAIAGTMLNRIRALAELVSPLPRTDICADPADNYLLAMAAHGRADYLATGDGRHLLSLRTYGNTRIVTGRELAIKLGFGPLT